MHRGAVVVVLVLVFGSLMQLQVCVASRFSIDLRVRLPVRLFHNDHWSPPAAPTASTAARSIPPSPPQPQSSPAVNGSATSDGATPRSPTVPAAAAAAAPPASSSASSVSELQLPNGFSYGRPLHSLNFCNIITRYETLCVRHGVMVVGGAMAMKTTIIHMLAQVIILFITFE